MILPTIRELRSIVEKLVAKEQISWWILWSPKNVLQLLVRYRFLHFLFVGGGGVILALGTTWLLTQFVFGLESYFKAYLIGTVLGLIFNFTMYTFIFNTERSHGLRLVVYLVYMCGIIFLQALIVRTVTPFLGLRFYLLVIACVIAFFSVFNFLVFKLSLFNERRIAGQSGL